MMKFESFKHLILKNLIFNSNFPAYRRDNPEIATPRHSSGLAMTFFYFALLTATLHFALCTLHLSAVSANMESDNYELQMPNLNYASGIIDSANFKLGFTGGELAVGPYSSTGFKLLSGFWYLKTIIPFSFSVNNQVIEFDVLSAGQPKTATSELVVSSGGAGGYQVTTEENHEMMVYSLGAVITDVTGDNNDITEENAGEWTTDTAYGFGYSLYGDDVVSPFPATQPGTYTYFKQFANLAKDKIPQVIMSSSHVGKNQTANVVYKINIPTVQAAGRYQNVITYIATPTY